MYSILLKGTTIIFIEYSEPSILSTVLHVFLTLEFAAIQFCQRTFFQRISEHKSPWKKLIKAAVFSEQHRFYWNESSYLKELLLQKKVFFQNT